MRPVELGPEFCSAPLGGRVTSGMRGPLQKHCFTVSDKTQKSTMFLLLFIWKLYLSVFIYTDTYIACVFTNKCVNTVRGKRAWERGKAHPSLRDLDERACSEAPCWVLHQCRHHQPSLKPGGRKGITLSVRGSVFKIGFGGLVNRGMENSSSSKGPLCTVSKNDEK